ncbi:CopG family transcriptional regulator [Streptomyces sp. NPDC058657]|uniref:CopG family transcriptional regulator n=1 Tax=unclassified Streptomyces TaxID=2593676 RepID=UPI0036680A63
MPAHRIAAVKERVGARGFSAYVSAAVERQIQRDLLEELIQSNEAEAGPIPQEMQDRAKNAVRLAQELAAQEESAQQDHDGQDEYDGEAASWHAREAG